MRKAVKRIRKYAARLGAHIKRLFFGGGIEIMLWESA